MLHNPEFRNKLRLKLQTQKYTEGEQYCMLAISMIHIKAYYIAMLIFNTFVFLKFILWMKQGLKQFYKRLRANFFPSSFDNQNKPKYT